MIQNKNNDLSDSDNSMNLKGFIIINVIIIIYK